MGEPSYLWLAEPGSVVARTVELSGGVQVDVGGDGALVGIERVDGPVTTLVLRQVLQAVRWSAETPAADAADMASKLADVLADALNYEPAAWVAGPAYWSAVLDRASRRTLSVEPECGIRHCDAVHCGGCGLHLYGDRTCRCAAGAG